MKLRDYAGFLVTDKTKLRGIMRLVLKRKADGGSVVLAGEEGAMLTLRTHPYTRMGLLSSVSSNIYSSVLVCGFVS